MIAVGPHCSSFRRDLLRDHYIWGIFLLKKEPQGKEENCREASPEF